MNDYSLVFLDSSSRVIEDRNLQVRDIWQALAQANQRLYDGFFVNMTAGLDPRGRVDVLDGGGTIIARIYCAEAITTMS